MRSLRKAGIIAITFLMLLAGLLPMALPAAGPEHPLELGPVASTSPRAVERPDHAGPIGNASFMYYQFKGSTKTYSINLKIWYPGLSATENGTPDGSGAPYPVIIQLPFMGGPEEAYNFIAPQIVSWGFISVCIGPNWADLPYSGNASDVNEILDMLEAANVTSGHKLYGMVQKSFGISGYSSGGGLAVIDAALVDRIMALQAMAPAITDSTLDALSQFFNKPFQFQAGQNDTTYRPHSWHGYNVFPAPKSFLDTKDGTHGGPFYWDCMISFFMRYLKGLEDYDTFLYGWGAMDDVGVPKYLLNFQLANGSFFPGSLSVQASALSVNLSEPVSFCATLTGYLPVGHPRGSFQWDFESDGTVDRTDPTSTSAVYSYDRSGNQRVSMWYGIGEYRLMAFNAPLMNVKNLPPAVRLQDSYSGVEDGVLQFNAEASDTPGDNESLNLSWEFGDGLTQGPSTARTATHSYKRAGNFTLKVAVRDLQGATASASARVTISNVLPNAIAGPDITGEKDSPVNFSGTGGGTPSDLPTLRFGWDFGDGDRSEGAADGEATHTYTRSGNFTAVLTVKDDEGALATSRTNVTIFDAPPAATITKPGDSSVFDKDQEVELDGLGTDTASDAGFLQYRWDFGDGNMSNWSQTASGAHTYTWSGRYTVRLQARDPDGAAGEAAISIVIRNKAPTVRLLSPWTTEVDEDATVRFAAEGADTESDLGVLNYTWTIDGRTFYGAEVNTSFSSAGVKEFSVTVRDPEGAAATESRSIQANNRDPKLSASVSPLRLEANHTVNFTATVNDTASDRPVLSILWEFGDGGRSTDLSGTHMYSRPGNYKVTVSVSDDEDGTADASFNVVVDPAPPPKPQPPPPRPDGGGSPFPVAFAATGAAVAILIAAVAAVLLLRARKK